VPRSTLCMALTTLALCTACSDGYKWPRGTITARSGEILAEGVGKRRVYPQHSLAAHVVGFASATEPRGLAGIEGSRNAELAAGQDVGLTLDLRLQRSAEAALARAIDKERAESGSVTVMDAGTGDVLALASWPTFDPGVADERRTAHRANTATEHLLEPGNAFKFIALTAALSAGRAPETLLATDLGRVVVRGRLITDATIRPAVRLLDVPADGSSVAAVRASMLAGGDVFRRTVRSFGFGAKPQPKDFPGSTAGIVWGNERSGFSEAESAAVALGYRVGVSPLQLASALATVVNRGVRCEARLVADSPPGNCTPVIDSAVAAEVQKALASSAARSGAVAHAVETGGLPGSSPLPGDVGYSARDRRALFGGFVLTGARQLAVVVVVSNPRQGRTLGRDVAMPVFVHIAEAVGTASR
jgi:cell division protein FtsI (penicillin-binding protein 3)